MANIRLEAESLTLENYTVETQDFASSGALARITDDTGSIRTTLGNGVTAGNYSIDIAYFDESDGQSSMELWVNGIRQDSWKFDNSPGGTRASSSNQVVRRVPVDIALKAGDTIELKGTLDAGEVARVDYIELIPRGTTTTTTPPAPINKAPVAGNDSATTQAGTPIIINVMGNDSDPDGDSLSISGISGAANGTVSSNANGTLTYTPKAGFSGNDSFSYSISDGKGGSATASVGVVVNPAPATGGTSSATAGGGSASVVRIEAESMTLVGYQKESASFASGGQLIRVPNEGGKSTATTQFTGVSGTYDLKVVYHDESDGKSTLKITAGTAFSTSFIFDENTGDSRASSGNRRERTFSGIQLNANDTIQLEGFLDSGEVARVDYIELIPKGGTTPTPTPANKAPIAGNDSATTQAGTPVAINVLSNDSDPDGDPLSISGVSSAANGTVSNANGTLTYTPKAGFSGNDSFNYSISDGKGGSTTATVGIVVNPAPPTGGTGTGGTGGGTASVVRIEAESMTLVGYQKESASFASGGQLIRVPNEGGKSTATTQFTGVSGTYNLKVVYHDESDGKSTLKITAGNSFSTSFVFDENTGDTRASSGNRRERTFSGVQLNTNDTIQLEGFLDSGEVARVDYIELIPPGGTPTNPGSGSGGSGGGTSSGSSAGGVILNLNAGVGLSPEFGALKMPRLMPLGDSITAGQHSSGAVPGGYRMQLEDRAIADGLSIDFIGSQQNGGSDLADKDHAGFPGRTIGQTTDWVKANLSKYPTDGILLMIGTNDANGGASGTAMRDRLSTLIDAITQAAPSTYLYVSSITPVDAPRGSQSKTDNINLYNSLIPKLVNDKAAQGKKVFFVNAGGSLGVGDINGNTSNSNDGLHPTAAGYDKLGDAWYKEVFNPKSLSGNKLVGTKYDDWLIGNSGNNVIEGGDGRDELLGGGGADIFVYKDPTHGKDKIVDFSSNDILQISAAGFGGGLSANMTLDSSSFISGSSPSATSNKATFLFNTSSKTLSFDRDGTGSASALEIATFTNGYSLQSDQIDII